MEAVKKLRTDSDQLEGDSISSGSEDEKESESGSESSIDPDMELNVEFEARNIESSDFLGIRRLLQQLFLKAGVDLTGLTDLVIANSSLYGSTVKVVDEGENCSEGGREEGDGNEVCGIISFISITHNQDSNCMQQLKEHLLSRCKLHSSSDLEELSAMLSNSDRPIGLLVSERLLNLPVQMGSLLLRSLLSELKESLPAASACELVVVIARSHSLLTASTGRKRKASLGLQREQHTFDYIENEFMQEGCLLSFSYPVGAETDQVFGGKWDSGDPSMKPFRTVMILPFSNLEHATISLEKALHTV